MKTNAIVATLIFSVALVRGEVTNIVIGAGVLRVVQDGNPSAIDYTDASGVRKMGRPTLVTAKATEVPRDNAQRTLEVAFPLAIHASGERSHGVVLYGYFCMEDANGARQWVIGTQVSGMKKGSDTDAEIKTEIVRQSITARAQTMHPAAGKVVAWQIRHGGKIIGQWTAPDLAGALPEFPGVWLHR